jgi:hypothetical protein
VKIRVVLKYGFAALVAGVLVLQVASAGAAPSGPLTRVSKATILDSIGYSAEVQPAIATAPGSKTLVSAFESGRAYNGGASAIGWATSVNGGKSFKHGLLPMTIQAGGAGGSGIWRGADSSVAYSARYGQWLIAATGLGSTANTVGLYVSRSGDGKSWSSIILVHAAGTGDTPSKSWVTCDNYAASSGYGNCYIAYTNTASTPANQLFVARSTDGGATWSAPVGTPDTSVGTGAIPEVQPPAPSSPNTCGRLVVSYANGTTLNDFVSSDCGGTNGAHAVITSTQAAQHTPSQGLRVSLFPSATVDKAGAIYLAYQTRSFRITQTTLSAAASAGATNIKVASVTGMVAGNTLTVDPTGSNPETVTISTVGTAGAGGTGITFTPALAFAHAQGAFVTVNGVPSTSTAAPNDVAMAVMPGPTDATPAPSFGTPSRIAIESDNGASTNTVDHFIPAIAADPATSGGTAHLALFYYYYPVSGCGNFIQDLILPAGGPQPANQCQPKYGYASSINGGTSWSAPQTLASMPSLAVLPRTGPIGTTGNGNPDLGLYTAAAVIPFGPLQGNAISVFDYGLTTNKLDESMYVPSHGLTIGGGS